MQRIGTGQHSSQEAQMRIRDLFSSKPKQFVSHDTFESNLALQIAMTPQTLGKLREYNVTADQFLKLEFFFYTNSASKAIALTEALAKMQYEVGHGPSASNGRLQVVTGWTSAIQMQDSIVVSWSEQMCKLGFEHDCEFDGWGTYPE